MKISQEIEKKLASQWFTFLQHKILEEFQNLEVKFSKKSFGKRKILKMEVENIIF